MRGISEKELKDKQDVARRIKDYVRSTLIDELISECQELKPWIPIDENTPKDRPLLLFVKYPEYIIEGSYDEDYEEWHDIYFNVINKPTHYQELPETPL